MQTSASLRSEGYKLSRRNDVDFVVACLLRVVGDDCSEARYGSKDCGLRAAFIRVHDGRVDDMMIHVIPFIV